MGIGKFFSEAARLLFMGVGISDSGTIPRKVDLWKIAAGNRWKVIDCAASNIHYRGKEAVRLKASGGDGLALYEALLLADSKIDLSIAAITQKVGLVVRAKDEATYELIKFEVRAGAKDHSQVLKLVVSFDSNKAEVDLPAHLMDEWVSVRVVLDAQFTAVFVQGNNMPGLKVPAASPYFGSGFIGLWVERESEALVADLRYIQSRKRGFE